VYRHVRDANSVTAATPQTREFVLHGTIRGLEVRTPSVNSVTLRRLHPSASVNKLK
jgi:hypothetical protein